MSEKKKQKNLIKEREMEETMRGREEEMKVRDAAKEKIYTTKEGSRSEEGRLKEDRMEGGRRTGRRDRGSVMDGTKSNKIGEGISQ